VSGAKPRSGIRLSTRPAGDQIRTRIESYIADNQGCHLASIIRALGLGNNQAALHLRVLESGGKIWSRRDGRFLRFHTNAISKLYDEGSLPVPPSIHAPAPLQIELLDRLARAPKASATRGPLTQGELASELDCSQQSVSYHLTALESRGFVVAIREGFRKRWRVTAAGLTHLTIGLEALPPAELVGDDEESVD